MGLPDDLERLKALHERGALSDDEFSAAKSRLLHGDPAPDRVDGATGPAHALRGFRRSMRERWIGGVCGGLEGMTGVPTWSWRVLFVLLALLHGMGVVLYALLWIFVPLERPAPPAP